MLWDANPDPSRIADYGRFGSYADILQAEAPQDWVLLGNTYRDHYPNKSVALVTTFNGITRDQAQYLQNLGFCFIVECDMPGNPNATPANQIRRAQQEFGMIDPIPAVYCYNGVTFTSYESLGLGNTWWIWDASEVTDNDCRASVARRAQFY